MKNSEMTRMERIVLKDNFPVWMVMVGCAICLLIGLAIGWAVWKYDFLWGFVIGIPMAIIWFIVGLKLSWFIQDKVEAKYGID